MNTKVTRAAGVTLPLGNEALANQLEEVGRLLESQGANQFRVQAYRTAAQRVRQLAQPAHDLLADEGEAGLMQLPGIGLSLARTIERSRRVVSAYSSVCAVRTSRSE